MRALQFVAVCLACSGLATGQTTDGTLWRYVHPEAKFLMGVDWAKAKNSPVGRMLTKQLTSQKGARVTTSGKGLEFVENLSRVLISSPSLETVSAESPGQVLIALEGKLDKALIKKTMPDGTAIERFKGVDLFLPPKGKGDEMLLAYVSEQFAVLGDRESISTALDNRMGLSDQAMLERATHLASSCEIWVVATAPPVPGSRDGAPSGFKQLQDIDAMELGVSLSKGLGLDLTIDMKDVQAAQGISLLAQMMMGMASNQTRDSSELTKALRSMKVSQNGKRVQMALDIPAATLEKGMTQMRSSIQDAGKKAIESLMSGQSGPPVQAVVTPPELRADATPPPTPATPVKKTIRIVGLDNGDREVTYEKQR